MSSLLTVQFLYCSELVNSSERPIQLPALDEVVESQELDDSPSEETQIDLVRDVSEEDNSVSTRSCASDGKQFGL